MPGVRRDSPPLTAIGRSSWTSTSTSTFAEANRAAAHFIPRRCEQSLAYCDRAADLDRSDPPASTCDQGWPARRRAVGSGRGEIEAARSLASDPFTWTPIVER
jgi:hypothetical protein